MGEGGGFRFERGLTIFGERAGRKASEEGRLARGAVPDNDQLYCMIMRLFMWQHPIHHVPAVAKVGAAAVAAADEPARVQHCRRARAGVGNVHAVRGRARMPHKCGTARWCKLNLGKVAPVLLQLWWVTGCTQPMRSLSLAADIVAVPCAWLQRLACAWTMASVQLRPSCSLAGRGRGEISSNFPSSRVL